MLDCALEVEKRVSWIKETLKNANAKGVVLGISGGKDCALVGLLCRRACENVTGIIMPCQSKRNYNEDRTDGLNLCAFGGLKAIEVDLTPVKEAFEKVLVSIDDSQEPMAYANINPRLRMITLYNYAQRKGYLVAGTGNKSEGTMGYFTKWGDGAYDFNPIADLTVKEIYELLRYLNCPQAIITKAPSAALFEGQTDEQEMGLSYAVLDEYILTGNATIEIKEKIDSAFVRNNHKRQLGVTYPNYI